MYVVLVLVLVYVRVYCGRQFKATKAHSCNSIFLPYAVKCAVDIGKYAINTFTFFGGGV